MAHDEMINVRYMVDDVDASIAFYTNHLGFELLTSASPAFAPGSSSRNRMSSLTRSTGSLQASMPFLKTLL